MIHPKSLLQNAGHAIVSHLGPKSTLPPEKREPWIADILRADIIGLSRGDAYFRNADVQAAKIVKQIRDEAGLPMPLLALTPRWYLFDFSGYGGKTWEMDKYGMEYTKPPGPTWESYGAPKYCWQAGAFGGVDLYNVIYDLHLSIEFSKTINTVPFWPSFPYTFTLDEKNFYLEGSVVMDISNRKWLWHHAGYLAEVVAHPDTPYTAIFCVATKQHMYSDLGNYRTEQLPDGTEVFIDLNDKPTGRTGRGYKTLALWAEHGWKPEKSNWHSGAHFDHSANTGADWYRCHTLMSMFVKSRLNVLDSDAKVINTHFSDRAGGLTQKSQVGVVGQTLAWDWAKEAIRHSDYITLDPEIKDKYDTYDWNRFRAITSAAYADRVIEITR